MFINPFGLDVQEWEFVQELNGASILGALDALPSFGSESLDNAWSEITALRQRIDNQDSVLDECWTEIRADSAQCADRMAAIEHLFPAFFFVFSIM